MEEITDEGAIVPLIKLLSSADDKIQLNAAATLWNLSVDGKATFVIDRREQGRDRRSRRSDGAVGTSQVT